MVEAQGELGPQQARADKRRNRRRLLQAAAEVFRREGAAASLDSVARVAKLGIGTLYRHFPTREALFEAVYRNEVEQLVELANRLATEPDPVEALRRWLEATVAFVATKKGMAVALAIATSGTSELAVYSAERLTGGVGQLLERAVSTGALRGDVGPDDVLRMLVALCYGSDAPGWQANVLRLLDVFLAGMRSGGEMSGKTRA